MAIDYSVAFKIVERAGFAKTHHTYGHSLPARWHIAERRLPDFTPEYLMATTTNSTGSVTRHELYELIWSEPMTKVAPRFGLSDVGLAKLCKRFEIPRPPIGYWAQKKFGKEPAQTPLRPPEDESWNTIRFETTNQEGTPKEARKATDRVNDEQLRRLIAYEERPENRISVSSHPSKYPRIVQATKDSIKENTWHRQGLYSPSWSRQDALLDIQVSKKCLGRAFCFMHAFITAFEKRGHKVACESREYRNRILFVMLGETFTLRLREVTKMIRAQESERKHGNRISYEPTGMLELQLRRDSTGFAEVTWRDKKKATLEGQLNTIMIDMIVAVERERNWRRQREESERRRQADELQRRQDEQERRKEEQKISELNQLIQNWEQASRIRDFMADVRRTNELERGPIEDGSELATWIEWALKHADSIDPLASQTAVADSEHQRPNRPR